MSVLTHFPKSRLSELVGSFGGLTREEAVEAATRQLEIMRPETDKAITSAITQMEALIDVTERSDLLMRQLLPFCDQLVTLAGTFGYVSLDKAARSFCDLLDGLLNQGKDDLASIRVHVQTIRMLAPGATLLSEKHTELMLLELQKLLDFYNIVQPDSEGVGPLTRFREAEGGIRPAPLHEQRYSGRSEKP
jgi:hypothetical protein